MRIVHVHDMANVATGLAAGQRALGHESIVAARRSPFLDAPDVELPRGRNQVADQIAVFGIRRYLRDADVIHLHGGIERPQLIWLAVRAWYRRRAFVVQLHGSDARPAESAKGAHYLGFAHHLFCSTPELRMYVPGAEWLPSPVALPVTLPATDHARAVVGHFPTDRRRKGTDQIVDAFGALGPNAITRPEDGVTRMEGERAVLVVVEGVPHARALTIMDGCDIVVDQVNDLGIYSVVSIEAMARAKVTMSSYDPSLYPDPLPIIRLSKETMARTFREVLDSRDRWAEWSAQARAYAERVHDPRVAARRSIEVYREVLDRVRGK